MTISYPIETAFDGIPESGLLELPTAVPLSGPLQTWTRELFTSVNGTCSVGFWEIAPGRSEWNFATYTEVIQITEGILEAVEHGGDTRVFGPGDVVVFPIGWSGEWFAPEGLKKLYVTFP